MRKSRALMLAVAATVASILGAGATMSQANVVNSLVVGNSSVAINYNGDPSNLDGMYNWTVDGTNQMNQQWFWYRVGATGTASRLNSLTVQGSPQFLDTNGDGKNDWAKITYADASKTFQVSVTYSLTGGQNGSHMADVAETIKIVNTGTSSLDYHFFQYSDFNLGGTATGQSVSISPISGANTATQTGAGMVSQTVISPKSMEYAAGLGGSGGGTLLAALDGTSGLTLSGPATVSNVDAAWAFEWDKVLAPGASYVISVDKQIHAVPEPTTTMALAGLGGVFLTRPRRRDEDPDPRTALVAEA